MSTTLDQAAAILEPADVIRAEAAPRTLPPAILTGPSRMWRFLDDIAAAQDRRRTEAAARPLTVVPPTRGADLGPTSPVYVRTSFPRQLPGNRPDVGHPRWPIDAQEADFMFLHGGTPPSDPEGLARRGEHKMPARTISVGFGESGSAAREAAHNLWVANIDPDDSAEPFVDVIDPSHGDGPGDRFLDEHGCTRTGRDKSTETRGAERRPISEAVKRALVHCADLGVILDDLRAPYRPRPGQRDQLLDIRRSVAMCLRLEGFKSGTIALVLDRDDSKVRELLRDPRRDRALDPADDPYGIRPFWQEVDDDQSTGEDSRGSVMRWRREQSEIAAEVRNLYTNRPIDIRREVSKTRRKRQEREVRLARVGPRIEEAVRRRLESQNPCKS